MASSGSPLYDAHSRDRTTGSVQHDVLSLLRRTLTKAEAHSAITGLVDTEFYRVRVAFHTTTLQVNGTTVVDPGLHSLPRQAGRTHGSAEHSPRVQLAASASSFLLLDSSGAPHVVQQLSSDDGVFTCRNDHRYPIYRCRREHVTLATSALGALPVSHLPVACQHYRYPIYRWCGCGLMHGLLP